MTSASAQRGKSTSAPMALLSTHPRVGMATFEAYWEEDKTGDYPGQQVCEIMSHTYERGHCEHCGAVEHRHTITDRLLVSPNAGHVSRSWWQRRECTRCPGGSGCLSNYRRPW